MDKQTRSGGLLKTVKFAGKILIVLLVIFGIFLLGVNVGSGRLYIGKLSRQSGLPASLNYSSVNEEYQALRNNYYESLNESQVLDGIKHGLAQSTNDPYTVYFTPKEAQQFNNQLNQTFSGIGAELGQDGNGTLQVIAPIADSPAAKAGLQSKDLIISINGNSTNGISVDQAVQKIRGPAGTKVSLGIVRAGSSKDITIVRENITVPSVKYKIINGNIGYMQITTFSEDTSDLAAKAAKYFKDNNVKGVVLDLRDNPGGLLDAAVNVSSLWLPSGTLVLQEKRGNEILQSYYASGNNPLLKMPTVVLLNSGSASASEITAGALHDNKAAYLVGEKSYGKGVVQQLINLSGGAQLKVTVASWYRPNGQNINKKGISPDKSVTLTQEQLSAGNDTQLNASVDYINSK